MSQASPKKNKELTRATRSQNIEIERAELVELLSRLLPVHKVVFEHVPVAVHNGAFAWSTTVLNEARAAEGQPAPLLFIQLANVPTASHT